MHGVAWDPIEHETWTPASNLLFHLPEEDDLEWASWAWQPTELGSGELLDSFTLLCGPDGQLTTRESRMRPGRAWRLPADCELVVEETFGPPIPIIRVQDIDDAIRVSNSTAFGLSSGVCTNRMDDIVRFINELETGTVNIWEVPGYRIEMSPFGGVKDSGLGYKEGVIEAMKSYTTVKTFSLPWG